jgi:hypothetical protein
MPGTKERGGGKEIGYLAQEVLQKQERKKYKVPGESRLVGYSPHTPNQIVTVVCILNTV